MQIWWVSYSIVHRNNLFLGSVQIYCYYVQKNCLFWASCRNNTVQWQGVPGFPCRAIFGGVKKYWFFGEIFTSVQFPLLLRVYNFCLYGTINIVHHDWCRWVTFLTFWIYNTSSEVSWIFCRSQRHGENEHRVTLWVKLCQAQGRNWTKIVYC